MDIRTNTNIRTLFSRFLYLPNPEEQINATVDSLIASDRSSIPLSYTGRNPSTSKLFSTIISVRGNVATIPDDSITTCVAVFIYYLNTVCNEKYKLFCPYPPENLLLRANTHTSLTYKDRFIGKTITDMCKSDESLGCKYSYPEIRAKHPSLSETEINLLYKIQNAFGREVDLATVAADELKLFRIDRKEKVAEKIKTTALEIVRKAITYVDNYFRYTEDELLMLSKQAKTTVYSLPYMGLSEVAKEICDKSIICKGALYTNFDEFKNVDTAEQHLAKIVGHYNKNINPVLTTLFSISFYSSLNDVVRVEGLKTEHLIAEDEALQAFLAGLDMESQYTSSVHRLDDVSDKMIYDRCCEFFKTRFAIDSPNLAEALTLLFFSFMTTSPAIRSRREWFCVELKINGNLVRVEFTSDEFINYIDAIRDKLPLESRQRNYIRLFCSKRANKAIKANRYFNFEPKLFSKYADIPNHMRIDFFKGLDTRTLTQAECQALHTLQVVTEYRTKRTDENKNFYLKTIGLL
nr:60kDa protein [Agapanthus velarivirus]QVY19209.1 60kDa protein [Agapanthus velarivirus]